jgi:ribulose-phosphate 3-epimerase
MRTISFSPSLMCADLLGLERDLAILEKYGFEYIHLDVMDGHFVPNITFGFDVLNRIGEMTEMPRDFHLMMQQPELAVKNLELRPSDLVTFHVESKSDVWPVIQSIKASGARVGLAINPDTPIDSVRPFLDWIDHILVMTVQPGFAGQPFVESSHGKLSELLSITTDYPGLAVGIDGAVGFKQVETFSRMGVSHFVLGTSALFKGDLNKQAHKVRAFKAELMEVSLV